MRCLYCHNPDTWSTEAGTLMESDEILNAIKRNQTFYTSGGITATGGEPLMQIEFLIELFTKAKETGIHTCLDTSGILFNRENPKKLAQFDQLLSVTDLILLDIKHINPDEHKKLTSHSNTNILDFARYLDEKQIPVWIRHVVVPEITYKKNFLIKLGEFLSTLHNITHSNMICSTPPRVDHCDCHRLLFHTFAARQHTRIKEKYKQNRS